jgi:hypothetical protein
MHREIEARIRRAVEAEEYAKAAQLWGEYAQSIRARNENGSAREQELADAGALLEWARTAVRCARSHSEARLRNLRGASAYGGPRSGAPRMSALA